MPVAALLAALLAAQGGPLSSARRESVGELRRGMPIAALLAARLHPQVRGPPLLFEVAALLAARLHLQVRGPPRLFEVPRWCFAIIACLPC